MAAPTRSQPRLKSLSLSSSSTPFEGASSPPSPSLNGRKALLHKSSSIADLRQSFATMSKSKFLKRFTSKDKDLFGCAGEEGAAGAFSGARGSSDLDLDELDEEEDAEMHEVSYALDYTRYGAPTDREQRYRSNRTPELTVAPFAVDAQPGSPTLRQRAPSPTSSRTRRIVLDQGAYS